MTCSSCGRQKTEDPKGWVKGQCRKCYRRDHQRAWNSCNKETRNAYTRKWREANKEKRKATRRNYELNKNGWGSSEVFKTTLDKQQGKCLICSIEMGTTGKRKDTACADHNHETGKARGILCRLCNSVLGFYERTLRARGVAMQAFEDYLKAHD